MKELTFERQTQWHSDALAMVAPVREAYERGENLGRCDETACFLIDVAHGMYQLKCWDCPVCAASGRAWWRLAATLPTHCYEAVATALKMLGAGVPPLVLEPR